MGKEVKIGVAIVAVLVLVLGAVITWRLMRTSGDETASTGDANQSRESSDGAESTSEDASGTATAGDGAGSASSTSDRRVSTSELLRRVAAKGRRSSSDDSGSSDSSSAGGRRPTVLSPRAMTADQSETASAADIGRWSGSSSRGVSVVGDDSASDTADTDAGQPSYMPAASRPAVASPYDRRGEFSGSGRWGQAGRGGSAGSAGASDASANSFSPYGSDPFRCRSQGGQLSPEQTAPAPPTPGSDLTPPAPSYRDGIGRAYDRSRSNYGSSSRQFADPSVGNSMAGNSSGTYYGTGRDDVDALGVTSVGISGADTAAIQEMGRQADGTYRVQPNDNFWRISERLYGTGAYFKALAECNRDRIDRPNDLRVGQVIDAPDVAQLEQDFPDLCPKPEHRHVPQQGRASMVSHRQGGETYTVAEGDTLFRIARYELGDAKRWAEIYQLNRDLIGRDFNHLRPGTELLLPTSTDTLGSGFDSSDRDSSGDAVTRRPGATWQR